MLHKKIRVCFVSLSSYPLFNISVQAGFGGAEVQLFTLATTLARDPFFEVSCIVGDYGQSAIEYREGTTLYRSPSFMCAQDSENFTTMLIRKSRKWWRRCQFAMYMITLAPDFFVIRSASKGVGFLRLWSLMFGGKLIYMVAHEIDCSGEYEKTNPHSQRWYRYGLTHADAVIAQHSEQARLLRERYAIEAVVLPSVYPMPNDIYEQGTYLLWVGRCEPWKRPDIFINVARQFSDHHCIMIAPPAKNGEEYAHEIQQACAGVQNLSYIGLVPFHAIDEYFRKALFLVITSQYEGFPNTLIQAARHKKAIVSLSVNPGFIFDRHDIGGCAHGNSAVFFKMVGDLLHNHDRLKVCGYNAFQYARTYHSLDAHINEYKNIFIHFK